MSSIAPLRRGLALGLDSRTGQVRPAVTAAAAASVSVLDTSAAVLYGLAQKATAADAAAGDGFASAIAMNAADATYAIAGAPAKNKVYIFAQSANTWQALTLAAPTGTGSYGAAVAMNADGSAAIVGAPGARAAYVYTRAGSGPAAVWTRITVATGVGAGTYGTAVAISSSLDSGYYIAVGDPSANTIYMYYLTGSTVTALPTPTLTTAVSGAQLGAALTFGSQGILAAGAPGERAVYTYSKASGTATTAVFGLLGTKFTAADTATGDRFGAALAITDTSASASTLAIGAPGATTTQGVSSGAVYVFTRASTAWTQTAKLTASTTAPEDQLGTAVALDSTASYIAAGAPYDNTGAGTMALFARNATTGTWSTLATVAAPDAHPASAFGSAVALAPAAAYALIGAQGATTTATGTGAMYWLRQASTPVQYNAASNFTTIAAGSSNILYFNGSNGYMGVNKPAPAYPLDITGDLNITGALRLNGTAYTLNNDASAITQGTLAVARGGTGAASLTSNAVLIGAGTGAVVADSNLSWTNSKLCIGSNNPKALSLSIKTGTNADSSNQPSDTFAAVIYNGINAPGQAGLQVKNNWASSNTAVVDFGNDYTTGSYSSYYRLTGDGVHILSTGTINHPLTPYKEVMRITSTGNIGIGTNNPGVNLHIQPPGVDEAILRLQPANSNARQYDLISTSGGSALGQGAFAIYDRSGGGTRMIINSSGNIGIGTVTPNGRLTVQLADSISDTGNYGAWDSTCALFGQGAVSGASSGAVAIGYNNTSGNGFISCLSPGVSWRTMNYNADRHRFYYGGNLLMTINNSGNVGIGTSNPSCSLTLASLVDTMNFRIGNGDDMNALTFITGKALSGAGVGWTGKIIGINMKPTTNASNLPVQDIVSGGLLYSSAISFSSDNGTYPFAVYTGGAANTAMSRRLAIDSAGGVSVPGTLSKGGGSFDIEHPDPAKAAQNYRLRHCFVESPTRGDNIYRFTVTTQNKVAAITLPDYYQHLNENTQVWVSADFDTDGYGRGRLNPENPLEVQIRVSTDGVYNVLVIGTRKDKIMRDFWDEKGAEYQTSA